MSDRTKDVAQGIALRAARIVFQKRGDQTEAHLSEMELRIIIQAAIQAAIKELQK